MRISFQELQGIFVVSGPSDRTSRAGWSCLNSPRTSYVPRRSAHPLRHLDIGFFPGRSHACGLVIAVAVLLLAVSSTGCSVMINKMGEALVSGNSVYATDDDPDLVWEAVPFGLKTIEGLPAEGAEDKNLLLAASTGFTQYGYGHLQQDADFLEANDLAVATAPRTRARKMYRRALDYGLRGLEVDVPDFRVLIRKDPQAALNELRKTHVPLLYWTAEIRGRGDLDLQR